jgi:hypothetical protein
MSTWRKSKLRKCKWLPSTAASYKPQALTIRKCDPVIRIAFFLLALKLLAIAFDLMPQSSYIRIVVLLASLQELVACGLQLVAFPYL